MLKKCPHCNRVSETDDVCTLHGRALVTMKPVIAVQSISVDATKVQQKPVAEHENH